MRASLQKDGADVGLFLVLVPGRAAVVFTPVLETAVRPFRIVKTAMPPQGISSKSVEMERQADHSRCRIESFTD
jgi:hypothetical protein